LYVYGISVKPVFFPCSLKDSRKTVDRRGIKVFDGRPLLTVEQLAFDSEK
jgi:hypothetical protein